MVSTILRGVLAGHNFVKKYAPASIDEIEGIRDKAYSLMKGDLPDNSESVIEFEIKEGVLSLQRRLCRTKEALDEYKGIHVALYKALEKSGFEVDLTRVGKIAVAQYREESDPNMIKPNVFWDFSRYINKEKGSTLIIDVFDPN